MSSPLDDERLRLAIEAGQLGIWDWDIEAERVPDFARLVHPDDAAAVRTGIDQALKGGASFAAEFRVTLRDGSLRWLATRAEVVRDATGKPVRMVGSTNDVTERVELLVAERQSRAAAEGARRRLELLAKAGTVLSRSLEPAALALDNARSYAEAEAALKEAELANRSKDEFLAMLGHELRNPLAPIVTALHVMRMRGGDIGGEERRIIERQVAHLSRLVDDLLDVSRITKGKIQLERELVNMQAVVARALELTQPALDRRAHPVQVHLPAQPIFVSGDPVRLAQIVCNLLTNAAKFTPSNGRIELRLAQHDGEVTIAVEDSGKGIAADLLPRVFELFVQSEQPLDRQAGGLGLGLAIVRTLVLLHRGTVRAESPGAGLGSTFTVTLPAADHVPAGTGDAVIAEPEMVRGAGRILIVDDNHDAAETLASLLGAAGYEIVTHADGHAAMAALDGFAADLAILDIGLPGMDGYELARRMRAHARGGDLRLVALTGYGQERDRARALSADFDEHMVKPVAPDRLFEVVQQLIGSRRVVP